MEIAGASGIEACWTEDSPRREATTLNEGPPKIEHGVEGGRAELTGRAPRVEAAAEEPPGGRRGSTEEGSPRAAERETPGGAETLPEAGDGAAATDAALEQARARGRLEERREFRSFPQ